RCCTVARAPGPTRGGASAQPSPASASAIENPCGTAPGIRARLCEADVFCLPGVPDEMKAMFDRDVLPVVRIQAGGRVVRQRLLRCVGLGESDLGEKIVDLMARGRNPEVGTTASSGEIGIRINAVAESVAAADRMLDETERELAGRLGSVIYGRDADTLAGVVLRLLRGAGATLATAESCTGGWIGKLLTDCPGSSTAYRGGVVAYSNDLKTGLLGVPAEMLAQDGAVSASVAQAMAIGVRERCGADIGVSVTGIAGPGGGSAEKPVGLVYIGVARADSVEAREYRFGADMPRTAIRLRAARTALNRVRLLLVEEESSFDGRP
ncbi:MAG: nicotinamide-nucleotide amidohydrolase family protein, partial [Planctomycetota bacterium]